MSDRLPIDDEDTLDDHRMTALGRSLVARIYGLLRAVRIYDLTNQAVRDQLHELLSLIEGAMEDEVLVLAMGQCFYVNGARLRAENAQIALFGALTQEFERRQLAGIRFLEGVSAEELGAFMRLMSDHADAEQGPRLVEAAAAAHISHIVPVTLDALQNAQVGGDDSDANAATDARARVRVMYRQAVRGAKAAILRTAKTGRPAIRRAKRVVQPIVDSLLKNEYSVVGLTAIKNHDEYTYAHCVNVGILSIAIGHSLGFSRSDLANLGLGALLHDVGKLTIPIEVLAKPGRLDPEEWTLMHRHPLEGVKTVTRMPGLSTLTIDVLDICLYHHRRMDGSGYPEVVPGRVPPPMARIVAVADCYDAMTTHRSYRARPFTGYEALHTLVGPDRAYYDPAALWGLVQTVGVYPAGTLLETASGHMVLSLNNDREDLRRPQCRVLARPGGTLLAEGPPEIWDPMPRHESVARVVPPEEFEGEIDRLLAA
jgi:HD-GYP domain-containing protein (c-di-GMP phosphodiesterase class II)